MRDTWRVTAAMDAYKHIYYTSEMDAYDQLGPLTRAALARASHYHRASGILHSLQYLCCNPHNPGVDEKVANDIRRWDKEKAMNDPLLLANHHGAGALSAFSKVPQGERG